MAKMLREREWYYAQPLHIYVIECDAALIFVLDAMQGDNKHA